MNQASPYVLIPKAAELFGYTAKAIERKIESGHWREGVEWRRAPDGRRFIIVQGVVEWVEQGLREGGPLGAPARLSHPGPVLRLTLRHKEPTPAERAWLDEAAGKLEDEWHRREGPRA